METKLKVITIIGTRPEIIRLSRVITRLDEFTHHILVHTGQNYDPELNEIFFKELEIRKPDYIMKTDPASMGSLIGDVMRETERILRIEKPDAVLILGDTNSSLAGIIARRLRIPLYHMEAGNRSWDENVPEEINRRIIDHIADFNLPYTEHARRNLLAEGLPPRRIVLSGSPIYEVLTYYQDKILASEILSKLALSPGQYFVVSMHREENVDHPERLQALVDTLQRLQEIHPWPVIVSTHPRTRKRLEERGLDSNDAFVIFHPPFGYFDYIRLQQDAACVLSDSGTISEEAAILGFPAVTIRRSMERPEALDAGTITLAGVEAGSIIPAVEQAMAEASYQVDKHLPWEYLTPDTSWRVLRLIMGTARLSNIWNGVDMPGLAH